MGGVIRMIADLGSKEFLKEIRHLFGSATQANDVGKLDAGFNCFAVAFVTMFLCRLRELAVDICYGSLLLGEKTGPSKHLTVIDPHVWVGSPKHRIIDLSIADYEGHEFLAVLHDRVISPNRWLVRTTLKDSEFARVRDEFLRLPEDRYMLYHIKKQRMFVFSDVKLGAKTMCSPPTNALLNDYADLDLLAKSILHLHLFLQKQRGSLTGYSQTEAWEKLHKWKIVAHERLESLVPKSFD